MKLPKFKVKELNNTFIRRKKDDKKEVLKWCIDKFIFTTLDNATLFGYYNAQMLTEKLKHENIELVQLQRAVQEHKQNLALSTH